MNPFGTRGAADFASALDGAGVLTLPGTALAARLRAVGASLDEVVVPRAEFREALRTRLMAVATVQAAQDLSAPVAVPAAVSWRRRTGTVAAGAMASVVAVSGVAVAGSQSLPGDPFYGVKKTAEAFQLRTADGDLEKGAQHLEFAATRLREVRGLTLGRDKADAGPEVGRAAASGGITLRSTVQPVATGDALSAPVTDRVRETLAAMDEQTREGTALLTEAARASQTREPLRVLNRFASRQSASLEQLLPALPPRSQDRALISLVLLTEVAETTDELLALGTCAGACDPSTAAPVLPAAPGAAPTGTEAPCDCASPAPAPAPGPTAPASEEPAPEPTPEPQQPEPTQPPSPQPTSSPSPAPSPSSSGMPLPVPLPPLPVPLPPLPVPLPTLTLAPAAPVAEPALPGTVGKSSTADAPVAPAPAPAPLPQVATEPVRP